MVCFCRVLDLVVPVFALFSPFFSVMFYNGRFPQSLCSHSHSSFSTRQAKQEFQYRMSQKSNADIWVIINFYIATFIHYFSHILRNSNVFTHLVKMCFIYFSSYEEISYHNTALKGSMTHLQALQISMKFLLQVASDIRRIL